jgi:hypothetical protein
MSITSLTNAELKDRVQEGRKGRSETILQALEEEER